MKDQIKENERVRKALDKENDFLKEEVLGKGADTAVPPDRQNIKTETEKSIED